MSALKKLVGLNISPKVLRKFDQFNGLAPELLKEICEKSSVIELAKGRVLFKEGDKDSFTYFLIKGEMEFSSSVIKTVFKGGTEDAEHALYEAKPRPVTAKSKSKVSVLSIETAMLEFLLDNDSETIYEVNEIASDDNQDWMTRFIQTLTEMKLPAKNMQALMMRMQEVMVKAGDTVIKQFDNDEFYYIVKHGRCTVSRKASKDGVDVTLAELDEGDSFGEDALLSNATRSATIKMVDNGTLMRLDKNDFLELLADPIIDTISYADAIAMKQEMKDAAVLFIDVRQINDHMHDGIKSSLNIPLNVLRLRLFELDKKNKYVIYCDDKYKSSAAVFLMVSQGYDCMLLKDGLKQVPESDRIPFVAQTKKQSIASPKVTSKEKPKKPTNIVSFHGAAATDGQDLATEKSISDDSLTLKKSSDFAENRSDEYELKNKLQAQRQEDQEKAKLTNEKKELAEAETEKLRQEMQSVRQIMQQKELEAERTQQEYEQKLQAALLKKEQELSDVKRQTEQQLKENQSRIDLEIAEREQQLAEVKRQSQQQLEEAQAKAEQELLLIQSKAEQEAQQQLAEVQAKAEQELQEAQAKAELELELLQGTAQRMQESYLSESSELLQKQQELESITQELESEREQRIRYRDEYEVLSERVESESSKLSELDEVYQRALEENEKLKVDIHHKQVEADEKLNRLVQENEAKLEAELKEINLRMTDEKNKARAAEQALQKAQQKEAEFRAEAEAARILANQDRQKLSRLQEDKLRELEDEVILAEQAETARAEAEAHAAKLMADAEEARKQVEKNAALAAKAKEKAESGTSKIRAEIEAARKSAEDAMKRSEAAELERKKAAEEIEKHAEVMEAIKQADDEKEKAAMSDKARARAEQEVEKLKAKLIAQKKAALAARKAEVSKLTNIKSEETDYYKTGQYAATDLNVDMPNLLDDDNGEPKVGAAQKSGWISDALLWETTLGLREDEESTQYLDSDDDSISHAVNDEPVSKSVKKPVKKAQKKVEKKPAPAAKPNKNVSSFSARDPSFSHSYDSVNSSGYNNDVVEKSGSNFKMVMIGAAALVVVGVGVGVYFSTAGKDAKFPKPISSMIDSAKDKAKSVEKAISKATGGREAEQPVVEKAVSAPKITKTDIKIMKERTELKVRDAASAKFSEAKGISKVITQAAGVVETAPEAAAEVAPSASAPISDPATPELNTAADAVIEQAPVVSTTEVQASPEVTDAAVVETDNVQSVIDTISGSTDDAETDNALDSVAE